MMHICVTHKWVNSLRSDAYIRVGKLNIIDSDNGLSPGWRQAIIWAKSWIIVNLTLRNKLQWNLNQNSNIFIEENRFENVICKIVSVSSQPQCVNGLDMALDSHPWGWFNKKIPTYQYRKSHCGDKTFLWTSYLHNGISYTGKMTFYIESGRSLPFW